tara:strand:+ start:139 stop:453 length:315 start_codon:yes stop_codon:yes gene_type:complete
MAIPIPKFQIKFVKKTTNNMHEQRLAERFSIEDKNDVDILLAQIKFDARKNLIYQREHARQLLLFFRKHVDPDVPDNIFGCGGCAKKMIMQMFKIQNAWQNPTT